MCHIISLVRT